MSNLLTRSLSSVAFVILILGPLFISPRWAFTAYAILGGFTLNELLSLSGRMGTPPNRVVSAVAYALLTFASYSVFFMTEQVPPMLWVTLGTVLLAAFVSELFHTGENPFDRVSSSLIAPVYVTASFLAFPYFMAYRDDLPSLYITIALFALIWINDSGAYLIGRQVGRTKLFERLSPNKTWEGSIGGLICSLAAGFGLSYIEGMPSALFMMGFAFVCIVFGSLGDLFESRIKRAAGVKDSGKFLPGHGGFFDRFDAMMLAVPASILYFEAFLPKT